MAVLAQYDIWLGVPAGVLLPGFLAFPTESGILTLRSA